MGFDTALFVDQPVNASLLCLICSDVMEDATTACSEGHAFCKACLAPSSVNNCPSCRGSKRETNCLALRNLINDLEVKCSNRILQDSENEENEPKNKKRRKSSSKKKTDCCDWTGPLVELEMHKKDSCKFQVIACDYKGCEEEMARKEMKKHQAQCGYRTSKCTKCKVMVAANQMQSHDCPKEMTSCAYCNKRMLRKNLMGAGAPHYYKDDASKKPAARIAAPSTGTEGTPASTTSGIELFHDIMNERMPFVPTDAECEGHYKECPEVLLRCEFHKQGCTDRIPRKDLAKHHTEKAQQHSMLISSALDNIHERLEKGQKREHVTLKFPVSYYYLSRSSNIISDPTQVAGHTMSLKLFLHRDADESIAVAIRATGRSGSDDTLRISNVSIGFSKTLSQEPNIGFESSGPHMLVEETYSTHQFRRGLVCKDEQGQPYCMTRAKLLAMAGVDAIYVVASFSVEVKRAKRVLGMDRTSSPSPSPSRDYADY